MLVFGSCQYSLAVVWVVKEEGTQEYAHILLNYCHHEICRKYQRALTRVCLTTSLLSMQEIWVTDINIKQIQMQGGSCHLTSKKCCSYLSMLHMGFKYFFT